MKDRGTHIAARPLREADEELHSSQRLRRACGGTRCRSKPPAEALESWPEAIGSAPDYAADEAGPAQRAGPAELRRRGRSAPADRSPDRHERRGGPPPSG